MENVRPWRPAETALLVSLAAVPNFFWLSCEDVFILPKIALAAILLAVAALPAIARGRGFRTSVDLPVAALAAVAILSAASSADPWVCWLGQYQYGTFGILGLGICACAFYLAAAHGQAKRRMIRWMVAGSLPVAVYAIVQAMGFDPLHMVLPAGRRPVSTWGNPVPLGAYEMLVLPLAIYLALNPRNFAEGAGAAEMRRDRLLGAAGLALGVPALILTGTRSAWIGAAAGIAVLTWIGGGLPLFGLNLKTLPPGARGRRSIILLGAAVLAAGLIKLESRRIRADSARIEIWRSAVEMFKDRPMLGVGPDGFGVAFRVYKPAAFVAALQNDFEIQPDAHNDWLEILATMGIFGLAAFAWLHVAAIRAIARRLRDGAGASSSPGAAGKDALIARGADAAIAASLAAFFVQIKLTVLPWGILFLASALAGSLLAQEPDSAARDRKDYFQPLMPTILAVACVISAVAGTWLVWADHLERLGQAARRAGRPREAAEYLERAVALRPMETAYALNLDNLLWDTASATDQPLGARRLLLERAAGAALELLRYRPADPIAYHLLGRGELRRAEWAGEDRLSQAKAALDAASRLDPTFKLIKEDMREAQAYADFSRRVIRRP